MVCIHSEQLFSSLKTAKPKRMEIATWKFRGRITHGLGDGRNPGPGVNALEPFKALALTMVWSLLDEELQNLFICLKRPLLL